jgi:hypothetical protein
MNKDFITHFNRKTGGILRNDLAINFLLTNNHFAVSKTSTMPPQTSAAPAAGGGVNMC